MEHIFERTERLIGTEALNKLKNSKVCVFGVGGVGSHCIEALARGGIGKLVIVDSDSVVKSNINRQLVALHSTLGKKKVEVMKERILDINPDATVEALAVFVTKEDSLDYIMDCDYVVDAIDNVTAKLHIIETCKKNDIRIISCMGMGNKIRTDALFIDFIEKTGVCPLAKTVRKELRSRNIQKVKVLYSKEEPKTDPNPSPGKRPPASISFVPPVAGYMLAGEVIWDLCGIQ
ncbi:MAG: tRNA threonylcarbamoyladenosine dehydratase [Clostridiaceae bacterium]|nr:tRNA threonylcarbamoyladenosine dehydratase [Clostridiaceae bacterium]